MLISDRRLVSADRWMQLIVRLAREGVHLAAQIREKDLPAAAVLRIARSLQEKLRLGGLQERVRVSVNGRFDVALAAGAQGVHLPADGAPLRRVRGEVGDRLSIGISAHSVDEVGEAAREGADYLLFGPVFSTPSKAGMGRPQGLEGLARAAAAASPTPVLAVGGITPENVGRCVAAGARGVAVIRAVLVAGDPVPVARGLRRILPG